MQSATVANAATLDGYLLYVNNSTTQIVLGRQNGTAFVATLATITPATTTLNTTDRFRLRNRASSANLGNGWIEKTPSAYSIVGNRASKLLTAGADYRNNLVYRPAAEDRRDAEALSEFIVRNANTGYPQIMVRVQQSTVSTVDGFDGYMLFMEGGPSVATLARQRLGNYETPLAQFMLSEPLQVNGVYRMRLSAVGAGTVNLTASVERLANGQWTVIGSATASDASAQRIDGAGAVAFGGYIEDYYDFDNFRRTNLGTQ